jgi:hypothetical protein
VDKNYTHTRDIVALDEAGGYYTRHVEAMTAEGLHAKGDIAAELGWRDMRLDRWKHLRMVLGSQLDAMERVLAIGATGKYAGKSIYATTWTEQVDAFNRHLDGYTDVFGADTETGEAHIIHAALRLLMAHAVARATCDPVEAEPSA